MASKPRRKKVVIRTNVLLLMGIAYAVLLGIFLMLVLGADSIGEKEAWDMLEAPLMALIGGTLAISKDLITDDDALPDKQLDNLIDQDTQPERKQGTGEDN